MRRSLLWAATAGAAVLLAALVLGAVLFVRERGPAARRVDLDTWAATICAAGETYVDTIVAAVQPVDPTTLELTARKANAAKVGRVQVDAARVLVAALRSVVPPEPALAYHNALIASADDYIEAIEEQSAAIVKAASAQQIAVANAQARFRLQATDREVGAIAAGLSPQVTAALERQPGCGPQPGAPGLPVPGGA